MRSLPIIFTKEASVDLRNEFIYIFSASTSSVTARRYISRIRQRCESIGHAPNGGRDRSDFRPAMRSVPFEASAEIFYVVEAKRVRIARIFFHGQNYETIMRGAD